MRAMILEKVSRITGGIAPLKLVELPRPVPAKGEILIRLSACGVCHTELDEIEGRMPPPHLPVVPGHQAVGTVEALGVGATGFKTGDRIGISWIFSACGECGFCLRGQENLCPDFRATGRDRHGGYAEWMTAPAAFAIPIPGAFTDVQAAPLLCAGAIGYRALALTGLSDGQSLGLAGFGASAHLVLQMARHKYPRSPVFVFARDPQERAFALSLGAAWAGDHGDTPPEKPAAIIDTTPAWSPVVNGLEKLAPGGRLIINAIRKEDRDKNALLDIAYPKHLWLEKEIKSVANITRRDVREFLQLAAIASIRPEVQEYPLEEANEALFELKTQHVRGAKVLRIR